MLLQAGNLRLDLQTFPETVVNTSLGALAVKWESRSGGDWTQKPVTADCFCKLMLVLTSNFHKATDEEALGSSPLALGSQKCWGNTCFVLKAMFLGRG